MVTEIIIPKNIKIEIDNAIEHFILIADKNPIYIPEKEVSPCIKILFALEKTTFPIGKKSSTLCFLVYLFYKQFVLKEETRIKLWKELFQSKITVWGNRLDYYIHEIKQLFVKKYRVNISRLNLNTLDQLEKIYSSET
jgi:hypothetical protein